MRQNYLPILNNFESLFKSRRNYDVIIQAGEENNQKEIYSVMLSVVVNPIILTQRFLVLTGLKKSDRNIFSRNKIFHHITLNYSQILKFNNQAYPA